MPKFLAGCHYNEEEISQHLEKYIGYWPVQIHGNKFATGQILEKTRRSCEGADFRYCSWAQKSPEPCNVLVNLQMWSLSLCTWLKGGDGHLLFHTPPSFSRAPVEDFHLMPRKDMQWPSSSILGLLGEEEDLCWCTRWHVRPNLSDNRWTQGWDDMMLAFIPPKMVPTWFEAQVVWRHLGPLYT
jgi:hypothetical protein